MGNAQCLDVPKPCGLAAFGVSGFNDAQKLPSMNGRSIPAHGEVPDMGFVDYGVGNGQVFMRRGVVLPILRVCGLRVQNHGPLAVYANSPGIGVTALPHLTLNQHKIGIVDSVQIPFHLCCPGALGALGHLNAAGRLLSCAFGIEKYADLLGRRRPDPKSGMLRRPNGSQILPRICKF